jgi:hypothetical protein
MTQEVDARHQLENDLRGAIARDELPRFAAASERDAPSGTERGNGRKRLRLLLEVFELGVGDRLGR